MYTPSHHGYVPHINIQPFMWLLEKHELFTLLFFSCAGSFALICFLVLLRVTIIHKHTAMKRIFALWLRAKDDLDYWFYEHPKEINSNEGQLLVFYELGLLRQLCLYRKLSDDESIREHWLVSIAQPNFVPQTPKEQYGP